MRRQPLLALGRQRGDRQRPLLRRQVQQLAPQLRRLRILRAVLDWRPRAGLCGRRDLRRRGDLRLRLRRGRLRLRRGPPRDPGEGHLDGLLDGALPLHPEGARLAVARGGKGPREGVGEGAREGCEEGVCRALRVRRRPGGAGGLGGPKSFRGVHSPKERFEVWRPKHFDGVANKGFKCPPKKIKMQQMIE